MLPIDLEKAKLILANMGDYTAAEIKEAVHVVSAAALKGIP